MEIDKLEELTWIYHALRQRKGVYLLESVVDEGKSYSTSDVHKWGSESELNTIYEKIKDLALVRMHEAQEAGVLDKVMLESMKKTYYYKAYENAESDKAGDNLDDICLERLEELVRVCSRKGG